MIQNYPRRVVPAFVAGLLVALLATTVFLLPARAGSADADPKKAAVTAMKSWLEEIDKDQFAESWKEASSKFQEAVTEEQWAAALKHARTPLGVCKKRELASALLQENVKKPDGQTIEGEFVIAQFKTSFENLASAIETVTFQLGKDGVWRASGYYIKPAA